MKENPASAARCCNDRKDGLCIVTRFELRLLASLVKTRRDFYAIHGLGNTQGPYRTCKAVVSHPSLTADLVPVVLITCIMSISVIITWYTQDTTVSTVIIGVTVDSDENPGRRTAPTYLEKRMKNENFHRVALLPTRSSGLKLSLYHCYLLLLFRTLLFVCNNLSLHLGVVSR